MKKILLAAVMFTLLAQNALSSTHQVFQFSYYEEQTGHQRSEILKIFEDGLVLAQTIVSSDECHGAYAINSENYLDIVYDGFHGPGTGGGCHNASITIDVTDFDIFNMKPNEKQKISFKGIRFFDFWHDGVLERLK